jgi:hypothetical protein
VNEAFRPHRELTAVAPRHRRREVILVAFIVVTTGGLALVLIAQRHHHAEAPRAIDPTPTLAITAPRPLREVWPITLDASAAIRVRR